MIVVEPKADFHRLLTQGGASLISGYHQRFEPNVIGQLTPGVEAYKMISFIIPADKKRQIRRELERNNISRETLYPGLAETAEAIKRRYGIGRYAESIGSPAGGGILGPS